MTAILVRSPLQTLSMASTQRPATRRRSARHAFPDAEDNQHHHDDAPAAKKAKTGDAVNGTGKQAQANGTAGKGAGRKTRAAAYDEDDDGFTFSRTRAKKTTTKKAAEPAPAPAPAKAAKTAKSAPAAEAQAPPPANEAPKTSRRTKKSLAAIAPAVADEIAPKRRRSARLSGGSEPSPQPAVSTPAPEKPKRGRKSTGAKNKTPKNKDDGLALVGGEAEKAEPEQPSREGTKIALPFADTPIIKRNKEMRKGGGSGPRRSSTGLRGRRASSLIDSGTSNAVPHSEVPTEDFYKLIEQSLPEPRRMKQLLTWCGTRALPDKPSGDVKDASAIMAARAIQQELLNDFASKSELSNWFDREDVEPTVLVKKPNPRNEQNATKLAELEQEVKRLQEEKKAWESLLKTPSLLSSSTSGSSTGAPKDNESLPDAASAQAAPDIDPAILDDPEQARILASLTGLSLDPSSTTKQQRSADGETTAEASAQSSLAAAIKPPSTSQTELSARLQAITQSLEPRVDMFADGLHKVVQYRAAAERVADRILGSAAARLEERERDAKRAAGTEAVGAGDVLRALGSVLGGGGAR